MKVLLTGASGFVGSHILDSLAARRIPTSILLRPSSERRFLAHHENLEVHRGSINAPGTLPAAVSGATHVIHCAGCTRAVRPSDFHRVNAEGTRHLVEAVNAAGPQIQRFLQISSLAVAGPSTPDAPAREADTPRPVSDYGRSKLAGELQVREHCKIPYTILRPPAVYGPRDEGFFSMFKAVQWHVRPLPSARQALSLVFVKDLAEAVVTCLGLPKAAEKAYYVASPEITTARRLAREITSQMKRWTLPCPLPAAVLWPVCLFQEFLARLTGRASLLNLQKFHELRAPGWVCDPSLIREELALTCPTPLSAGLAETLDWYRREKWL